MLGQGFSFPSTVCCFTEKNTGKTANSQASRPPWQHQLVDRWCQCWVWQCEGCSPSVLSRASRKKNTNSPAFGQGSCQIQVQSLEKTTTWREVYWGDLVHFHMQTFSLDDFFVLRGENKLCVSILCHAIGCILRNSTGSSDFFQPRWTKKNGQIHHLLVC